MRPQAKARRGRTDGAYDREFPRGTSGQAGLTGPDDNRCITRFPGSSHELEEPQRELEGPEQGFSHVGPGDADELGATE